MKPRTVKNILPAATRFLTVGTESGTGSNVVTTDTDGLNQSIQFLSGSAGRDFSSASITLESGVWYCMSFEVEEFALSASGGVVSGLSWLSAPNTGTPIVSDTNIIAGGIGRYAAVFMDTTGGSFTWRLGVGLSANTASKSFTVRNLQLEKIDLSEGGFPSEYVYPAYKCTFNRANYSTISNNLVNESYGTSYTVDKGFTLLALGDSRTDEVDDIGGAISNALGINGTCLIHAEGGWTTDNLIGPTTLHTTFSTTYQQAIDGTLLARTFSSGGNEEMSDNQGASPDIVIISNMGVNDITAGTASSLTIENALQNVETIIDYIKLQNKTPCVTEITPFNAWASFSETNGDQVQTYVYNRRLKEIAAAKGAIFVPLYKAFGDSTDADKLSDGAGSTPDYSDDGLHLNAEGCRVAAGLILSEIQTWTQKN